MGKLLKNSFFFTPYNEWALDTWHTHLFHQSKQIEKSLFIYEAMEATLTPLMESIEADFPLVKTFSLPKVRTATRKAHVELGVKGDAAQTEAAFERVLVWLAQQKSEYSLTSPEKMGE